MAAPVLPIPKTQAFSKLRDSYASFRSRSLARACDVVDRSNWFKAVQADSSLPSSMVCLAGIISDRSDGGAACWVPQTFLATLSHYTTRGVRNIFVQMVSLGWLEILEGAERASHLEWRGATQKVDPRAYVYRLTCPTEEAFTRRASRWSDA